MQSYKTAIRSLNFILFYDQLTNGTTIITFKINIITTLILYDILNCRPQTIGYIYIFLPEKSKISEEKNLNLSPLNIKAKEASLITMFQFREPNP